MSAGTESPESRTPRQHPAPDQQPTDGPTPATTGPRRQPSRPRHGEPDRPTPLDTRSLGPLIDALNNWDLLAERPWDLALLIALDDGPTTSAAACTAAMTWAEGQLPDVDLPMALVNLVEAGLAVHLGGHGDAALFARTTTGGQLLDRFEQAASQLDLLNQLVRLADSCLLHDRLLQLTPTETRVLGLVVHGRTDQQIAAALFLSRRTVEDHVSRILRKVGIASRNALIARLTIQL